MIFCAKKIQVCCTHGVTGGPELLHQLVDELRKNGHDATIVYLPLNVPFECPEPYKIYDAPQSALLDEKGVLVVVPEVATAILRQLKNAESVVWWLSVDNYFGITRESKFIDAYLYLRSILVGRRLSIMALRRYRHLAQSYYALQFLERIGARAYLLGDYLRGEFFDTKNNAFQKKRDIIAYNPKKGRVITSTLRENNPDLTFVAIENMSPKEVRGLLDSAKLYIDFGHHPGKDRLPREAAMAGCCVITGRRGSANNPYDIPIPEEYKLDERGIDFGAKFRAMALSILKDYDSHCKKFDEYRNVIRAEKTVFSNQVKRLFGVVSMKNDRIC